jgi:hypothetical protein
MAWKLFESVYLTIQSDIKECSSPLKESIDNNSKDFIMKPTSLTRQGRKN